MLLSLLFLWGCEGESTTLRLSGHTMGTLWHVSVINVEPEQVTALSEAIQARLDAIDGAMSTYRPESDLSLFNQMPVAECIKVSEHTWRVTLAVVQIARETGGAFNPGVAGLVEMWGFGADTPLEGKPQQNAIDIALQASRLSQLLLDSTQSALCKKGPIHLDYSAIAKGYGVDQVVALLADWRYRDFLVEVGGEVRTAGLNGNREQWRIGIEKPQLAQGDVLTAIRLSGEAVATSGDYRNYREIEGVRYSHTIDPATGYPVEHNLTSVTVVAQSAMLADAYATAINVMGSDRGLEFAESKALPVYLVVEADSGFVSMHSAAFKPYLQ